uniref:Uncharacterized protein n=1 Tax=viral metagenome TaxID=1070528 RepID=A0A6C0AT03_9ZZZZ
MSKFKESFTYSSQNIVQNNGNSEVHSIDVKDGKGQEIIKTYKNGRLRSTKKKSFKPSEISNIRRQQSLIPMPLIPLPKIQLPVIRIMNVVKNKSSMRKQSRSKTHKKRTR